MADNWLHSNINKLGGRAVLMIIKNGEIIYQKTENNLSRKQRAIGKLLVRRQKTVALLTENNRDE